VRYYRQERERARIAADAAWRGREARFRYVLGQLASVFIDERTPETDRVLKELQQQRMIGYEDLTEAVKDRLAASKVAEELVANAPATLNAFRTMADAAGYRRMIGAFRRA